MSHCPFQSAMNIEDAVDGAPDLCGFCGAELSGGRHHHCSVCASVACDECSVERGGPHHECAERSAEDHGITIGLGAALALLGRWRSQMSLRTLHTEVMEDLRQMTPEKAREIYEATSEEPW